ncbi:hypothetical protein Q5H93_23745 [Hymenobacter sp. ASUV-10]|uniref:Outer membrane protein beta-barrel domain-containing protein n=1 Tax=Hymenobacter aranciens TaxID=3063996 RepID=A0ABT9BHM0_9BACT|nr:hypothetical protein [Hymenobacter sp. ASUV-10]MDO7877770.1 hypothetical protein [Hymenobacter sp. ASUV-10]
MKHVFPTLLSLAVLAGIPLASQASGSGSEGGSVGLTAPKTIKAKSVADGPFGEGTNVLNLGIGFGAVYSYAGTVDASPAFSASFEHGFKQVGPGVIGIGGLVGYQSTSSDLGYGTKFKSSDLAIAVRGAYHYPVTDAFDAYAGLGLGFRSISYEVEGSSSLIAVADYKGFYSGYFIGGRYFFTDKIGAFGELGYDQALLKVGLSVKF